MHRPFILPRPTASAPLRGPRCRQCGNWPLLARREPHPTRAAPAELRTYECPECGLPTRLTVPDAA